MEKFSQLSNYLLCIPLNQDAIHPVKMNEDAVHLVKLNDDDCPQVDLLSTFSAVVLNFCEFFTEMLSSKRIGTQILCRTLDNCVPQLDCLNGVLPV